MLIYNRKKLAFIFVLVFSISLILSFAVVFAETSQDKKVIQEEIKIAHITDLHYFAYDDCYLGDQSEEYYKTTDFYLSQSGDTKLIKQSGTLLNATIKSILCERPDYLIVSGDITSNGELRGHYDVSNALRYLQNEMRKIEGKENFQVFVIPGNHDLYNNRACEYVNEDEVTDSLKKGQKVTSAKFITSSDAFFKIYNGLGYPAIEESLLEYNSITNDMKKYYEKEATGETAFTTKYEYSPLATNISFEYFSDVIGFPTDADRKVGALSYVAKLNNKKYTFVMIDATERDLITPAVINTSNMTTIYHNQATGGRITTNMQNWFKEVLKTAKDETTVVGSCHFNIVPHFTMEENYTKDFTLYNWEDAAAFLADELNMRYIFTGHMHSSDVEYFTSYKGNRLQDFETGSIVSLHSPTRYTKIQRLSGGKEDAYTAVSTINTLKGIKSLKINETTEDESLCKFNGIEDLEKVIGEEIYDKIVERLLDAFVNASLIDTIKGLVASLNISSIPIIGGFKNAINDLVDVVLDETFYGLDYNIGDIEAENLFKFVREAVYQTDTLKMIVHEENGETFTLESVLISAYKSHLVGNEVQSFDSSTPEGRAAIKAVKGFEDGSIVETLLFGLLDPLLYEEDALIRQLITHKFDVSEIMTNEFNSLVATFIPKTSPNHPLNNGGTLSIEDILNLNKNGTTYKALMGLLSGSSAGEIVKEILNIGVVNWCEDMLKKYMTDAFFKGIGGILSETYQSFALDATPDGPSYVFNNEPFGDEKYNHVYLQNGSNYTYGASAVAIEYNQPTYKDGRLPSILTSTFGDDPSTSQNIRWFTNYKVGGKFLYREKGQTTYKAGVVTTKIEAVAVPLIDLGLYATTTATTYELDRDEHVIEYEQMHLREREGLHNSVKFAAIHTVNLTDLKPNTVYEYKVIGTYDEQEYVIREEPYSFKTAPKKGADEEFSFLAISDIQGTIKSSYELARDALLKAKEKNSFDFIINCGDVTDNGKNIKQWSYAQNVMESIFGNTSTVISAGNHEKSAGALAKYYDFGGIGNKDTQSFESGVYYSFNYANTHFTILNTNDYNSKGLGTDQYNWLVEDLNAANNDKDIKNIIVVMHKSLYSVGSHVEDKEILAMKKQLVPLFADNNVDLVLGGHDHTFSTTQLLDRDGNVVAKSKVSGNTLKTSSKDGVIYMTIGTISDKYYEYRQPSDSKIFNEKYSIKAKLDTPIFSTIKCTGDGIEVSSYIYSNNNDVKVSSYIMQQNGTYILPTVLGSIATCIAFIVVTYFIAVKKNFNKEVKVKQEKEETVDE